MIFLPTGVARLDHVHAGLSHCLDDLGRSVRDRDLASARGWACLLFQKLAEHFADEEKMMRLSGWPRALRHEDAHAHLLAQFQRFEQQLKSPVAGFSLSYLALVHLPALLRHHHLASDFGFAKFLLGRVPPASSSRSPSAPGTPIRYG
jgi:hemerythrin-like metal-binding protein